MMIWGSYKVYKSVLNGGGISFRGGWLYGAKPLNTTTFVQLKWKVQISHDFLVEMLLLVVWSNCPNQFLFGPKLTELYNSEFSTWPDDVVQPKYSNIIM